MVLGEPAGALLTNNEVSRKTFCKKRTDPITYKLDSLYQAFNFSEPPSSYNFVKASVPLRSQDIRCKPSLNLPSM
jgi:hypothetical protein